MRKALFVLLVCCFAFGTAFAQHTLEAKLSEDKSENETEICEQGRFFIKINGESDDQGRTPVQIELENNSNTFDFLLFDRAWPKKILRKNWKVYLDVGGTAVPVEGVNLDVYQESFIPHGLGKRYTFPDIIVEEGKTYECKIPIHVAQPKPNWFSKKKKRVYEIVTYTLQISVDNRDAVYEKLEHSCDSLKTAFDEALARKEFCTHRLHKPGFEAQVMEYTYAEQNLRDQINYQLANKSWSTQSKKYKHYTALLDSLDKMDQDRNSYEYDCGHHKATTTSCRYCNLSLQEIYNRLNRYWINLYNGDVQKSAIINDVNALYRCGTSHSNSKRAKENTYKAEIIRCYQKISSLP